MSAIQGRIFSAGQTNKQTTIRLSNIDLNILVGSHFGRALEEDSFFLSKVFHKIDGNQPSVLSNLAQRLSDTRPMVLKLSTKQSRDLTKVQTISTLKEALQVAVNVEMTVMFEYLFACFSVLNSSDEVDSVTVNTNKEMAPYFSELRREYKNQFMIICIQEMQHMSMAIDMLISIGGKPNLQQVHFPSEIGVSDSKADLIRLRLTSLLMFAKNEEPYPEGNGGAGSQTALLPSAESGYEYYSIAQLYNAINDGFLYSRTNRRFYVFTNSWNV